MVLVSNKYIFIFNKYLVDTVQTNLLKLCKFLSG